jgi:hypothetical protein
MIDWLVEFDVSEVALALLFLPTSLALHEGIADSKARVIGTASCWLIILVNLMSGELENGETFDVLLGEA